MKTKIAVAALTVPLLALAACGSDNDGGPVDERTRAGAIATLVQFSHDVGDEDDSAACDLIEPNMRADTCEESVAEMRTDREREMPDWFATVSAEDMEVDGLADSGCAYYIAGKLPTDPAVLVWHDHQWWVHWVGAIDPGEYSGELMDLDDVKAYPCESE